MRIAVKIVWRFQIVGLALAVVMAISVLPKIGDEPLVPSGDSVYTRVFGFRASFSQISVTTAHPRKLVITSSIFRLPLAMASLFVVHCLQAIFNSMTVGTPFTSATAKRISSIGITLLLGAGVQTISNNLLGHILSSNLQIQNSTVSPTFWPSISWVFGGFLGLILAEILAEIFRYGVNLQEEYDTVI